jgi:hypothetical protein
MLLLFVFLLWSLPLCFINWFRGCVLFSWYLFSKWQWWCLRVKVLWWWWWSLQWWFGKYSSSYLGCHFSKDVVLVHSLTLVMIQKILMGLQVWNIFFFFGYMGWKNHLWKCSISFFLFSYVVKKSLGGLQVCKYHYFFHICE